MPDTAMAQQVHASALAKGMEADFSTMLRFMEELAGVANMPETAVGHE
jgi:hypothetical protein